MNAETIQNCFRNAGFRYESQGEYQPTEADAFGLEDDLPLEIIKNKNLELARENLNNFV